MMRKVLSILAMVLLVVSLTACSEEFINEQFGYTVTKRDADKACATALDIVYSDDRYEYYFGCLESDRYIIKDEDGNEFAIKEILEQELLTIGEVYILFDGHLAKMEIDTSAIEEINLHSSFEYDISTEVTDSIKSDFIIYDELLFGGYIMIDSEIDTSAEDFNIMDYLENEPTTYYTVTAYPDEIDRGEYITTIVTRDPTNNIYDLSVGDSYTLETLNDYIESIGYTQFNNMEDTFEKNQIVIKVELVDDIIIKISVRVKVTNITGIQYWVWRNPSSFIIQKGGTNGSNNGNSRNLSKT